MNVSRVFAGEKTLILKCDDVFKSSNSLGSGERGLENHKDTVYKCPSISGSPEKGLM